MKKVAITGLSGVIGQIIGEKMPKNYKVIDLFHKKKYSGPLKVSSHIELDLLQQSEIIKILSSVNPDVVIHMASITHIDQCEKDKEMGTKGVVWKTNVLGTQEIAKFCARYMKHLIFLSTECVFSGKDDYYTEDAEKDPINWYGFTKHKAEESILASGAPAAIIRAVVAYHENDFGKTIYGKLLKALQTGSEVPVVADQFFTPTYTYDIVRAINKIMAHEFKGIFHIAPSTRITPYDFAKIVARKNDISINQIKETTLNDFYIFEQASLRLKNSSLAGARSNKILKMRPRSPQKGLL